MAFSALGNFTAAHCQSALQLFCPICRLSLRCPTVGTSYHKRLTMHEISSCSGRRVACDSAMLDETVFCGRILDTTQIRHLIAFASAVDITIECFHGAP